MLDQGGDHLNMTFAINTKGIENGIITDNDIS